MEQTPSQPGRSPELPSVSPPSNGEMVGAFSNPETVVGNQERSNENAPRAEQVAAPPLIAPPTPTIATVPSDDTASSSGATNDDLPTIANDDELIEKEWVDRAKKVIAETKDDPYRREQEVGRLQADYLAKRYGRGVKSSEQGIGT